MSKRRRHVSYEDVRRLSADMFEDSLEFGWNTGYRDIVGNRAEGVVE